MKPSLWMVLAALCFPGFPVAAQTASPTSYPFPRSRLLQCGILTRVVDALTAAVWADEGCRGDFSVTYRSAPDTATRRISCGTLSSRRDECSTHGVVDSVRLVKRSFFSRCEEGSNWGYGDTLSGPATAVGASSR